ncbi:type IV pilus modification protein PilV [Acidovorax sp. SRB_14]|uniref:type IV pilus modification protein PilV n=1 Tax=Acidovorax sp. SRB_14 TaxID=1962699 RepID=UPI001EB4B08A|nr:type IV pilus modification protein PilV [Acidovorax sp. SRB_14]NMM82096.1 type IV pilus modification protein PilV [Acidovorax sp. SRB_14]
MQRLKSMKRTSIHLQRGITLIESLVAIVVMALGILGILGVQMRTLSDTQTTVRRAQAIRLIEDLSERMKVNPNALGNINAYVSTFSAEPTPGDCSSGCSHSAQAAYDLAVWKQAVKNTLPLGQANIFLAPGEGTGANPNRRQLGVMVSWRENERDIADSTDKKNYKDNTDATQVRAADGTLTAGTDTANACPDDRTCHLQYIPVSARCAPYTGGGGTTQYFCPGS